MSPTPVPAVSYNNSVQSLLSCFWKILFPNTSHLLACFFRRHILFKFFDQIAGCILPLFHTCTCPYNLLITGLIVPTAPGEECKLRSPSSSCFLPTSVNCPRFSSRYTSYDPVLKRQSTFSAQCERQSFTPIRKETEL